MTNHFRRRAVAALSLALLVPGVAPPNLGSTSTQLFPETSAVVGSGVSISRCRWLPIRQYERHRHPFLTTTRARSKRYTLRSSSSK